MVSKAGEGVTFELFAPTVSALTELAMEVTMTGALGTLAAMVMFLLLLGAEPANQLAAVFQSELTAPVHSSWAAASAHRA
jgi:hypothetical protein